MKEVYHWGRGLSLGVHLDFLLCTHLLLCFLAIVMEAVWPTMLSLSRWVDSSEAMSRNESFFP